MKKKLMTPAIEQLLDNEAYRRFRGDNIKDRTRTKTLAQKTGLTYSYTANLIAAKRRRHEQKVDVSPKPKRRRAHKAAEEFEQIVNELQGKM